ncbi:putative amino acid/polyamine transporter I [Septoria linicola]|nr:putative amino acid/polyamine transporter I [Septoria linicola]
MARCHVLLASPSILVGGQCLRCKISSAHQYISRRVTCGWLRDDCGDPRRHDEGQAYRGLCFTEFSNTSGWSNDGVSWLVGLLSTIYPFLGYDAAAHLSEELLQPSKYVPVAMIGSIIINGLMGFIFTTILLYCLGDLPTLLESATGFPFVQLYFNVTGSHAGATILTLFHAFIALAANSAGLTSTRRTAWAFARDRAFPFSSHYSHLDQRSGLPVRMCILLTVLQFLLGLVYIGNTTAFNAVLSMAVVGIINVIALVWGTIAMIFSMFPSYQPVTPENMNYASLVLGGWTIAGAMYYFFCQRGKFKGPIVLD